MKRTVDGAVARAKDLGEADADDASLDAEIAGPPHALVRWLLTGRRDEIETRGDDLTLDEFRHCFKPQPPALRANVEFAPLERLLGDLELGAAALGSGWPIDWRLTGRSRTRRRSTTTRSPG